MIARRKFAVGQECRKIIEEAAQRCIPLTVTNQNDSSGWEVYKSHFLGVRANRLIISQPLSDSGQGPLEPGRGQEVAITFKKGYSKCLFTTRVIGQEQFELEPGTTVPGLVVYCPEQVERIQRRAYNRVEPPTGQEVLVTFWNCEEGQTSKQCEGLLLNLSAGGLGVSVRKEFQGDLYEGQLYQMEFVPLHGQGRLSVQGRLRHAADRPGHEGQLLLGFQFIGLEMSERGRSTIRRIGRVVSVYQRQQPISRHHDLRGRADRRF